MKFGWVFCGLMAMIISSANGYAEATEYMSGPFVQSWERTPSSGDYGARIADPEDAKAQLLSLQSNTDSISPIWKISGLKFKPDKVYAYTVKAKAPLGSAFRVYVESSDGGGWENYGGGYEGNGEWQTLRKEFSFKSDAPNAALVVSLGGPGSMLISEAKIEEVEGKTRKQLEGEALEQERKVSVQNGDFEKGGEKWILTESSEIISDPEQPENHVLKISVPTADETTKVVHGLIPVSPASTYTISYRIRGVKGKGDGNTFHWFRVYPSDGKSVPSELASYQSSFDQWQNKTLEYRTNSKQTSVNLTVEVRGPAEVLVDDIAIAANINVQAAAALDLNFPFSYRDGVFATHPEKSISGSVKFNSDGVKKATVSLISDDKVLKTFDIESTNPDRSFSFDAPAPGTKSLIKMVAFDDKGMSIIEEKKVVYGFAKSDNEISFNRGKVIMVNGKKFFPIGHTQTSHRGTLDFELEFFKEAGFNCLEMTADSKALDTFAKHGMMMIRHLPASIGAGETEEQRNFARERFVNELTTKSNHPALLAYFGADEPAWIGQSLSNMSEVYDLVKRFDPYHPIWVNEAPVVTSMSSVRAYSKIADIYGIDIYPVPEGSMHGFLDTNRTISSVGAYVDICNEIVENKKPIWMILQSFAWGQCHDPFLPPEKSVYPTWEQSRFMAYQSIVHGATGVAYHYLPYAKVLGEQFWKDLRRVTLELKYVSPILVEDSVVPCALKSDEDSVKVMQKSYEGSNYYIVVNESSVSKQVWLDGFTSGEKELNILLDESRQLRPQDGKVSVELPGYAVLVLSPARFSTSKEIYHDETYRPYNMVPVTLGRN